MIPQVSKVGKLKVTHLNRKEFLTLKDEIFNKEIYKIDLKKDNPVIFDLGAHIGLATLYFKSIYPKAYITCFEPNPNVIAILKENILMNNLSNIKIKEIALGKKDCKRELYIDSSGYGAFSTGSFRKNAWDGSQKSKSIVVVVEKLSKYVDSEIDLVKMDIEGNEKEVLKELDLSGCFRMINNLIIEYHPIKNHKIGEIVYLLEKNNFTLEFRKEGGVMKKPSEDLILVVAKKSI